MAYGHKSTKERWVEQISMSMTIKPPTIDIVIDSNDANVKNKTLCILTVPESFCSEKPEAYRPQKLGLGPYHHFREEVYKMEWDKVATVRSALNDEQVNHFYDLVVDKIKPLYAIIHAFYGKFVDMDADTFAWMFAIDGLFLLIQICSPKKEFVRDIMMLENQIPFLVLKELQTSLQVFMNQEQDDASLSTKLIKFCEEVSPLALATESQICARPSCRLHLLDLLYELIVNNVSSKQANDERSSHKGKMTCINEIKASVREKFPSCLCCRQALGHVRFMTCMLFRVILHMFGKKDEGQSEEEKINAQEIRIPSVLLLHDIANEEFKVGQGGIKNIEFNKEELTFYLPVITLTESTEVILRNLVAYEATRMKSSDILQFAEYVDLMCGIIDKPRDVELLRKRGIVVVKGRMDDEEIANLFNGIKRSTWDRKRQHGLDTALTKINDRFMDSAQVKVYRFMRKHVYNSWKFLTFLATIVLLILTAFQAFCDVYGCSDHFFSK